MAPAIRLHHVRFMAPAVSLHHFWFMTPAIRLHHVWFRVYKRLHLVFCFHSVYVLQCTVAVKEFSSDAINIFLKLVYFTSIEC